MTGDVTTYRRPLLAASIPRMIPVRDCYTDKKQFWRIGSHEGIPYLQKLYMLYDCNMYRFCDALCWQIKTMKLDSIPKGSHNKTRVQVLRGMLYLIFWFLIGIRSEVRRSSDPGALSVSRTSRMINVSAADAETSRISTEVHLPPRLIVSRVWCIFLLELFQ